MTDKVFNVFDECASRCIHHTKESAPCLPEGTVECIYTFGSIASSQRMLTEINESDTIAKIKISVESDTVKHLKAFRIISYEMPSLFLIIQVDDILVVYSDIFLLSYELKMFFQILCPST